LAIAIENGDYINFIKYSINNERTLPFCRVGAQKLL